MKNQGEKKTKKQKKTESQNMKSTHLLGVCLLGAFFYCKTGDCLSFFFFTQAYTPGGVIAIYIYIHTYERRRKNYDLNSCQSRFSGMYLSFEAFPDTWRSNKDILLFYWHAT